MSVLGGLASDREGSASVAAFALAVLSAVFNGSFPVLARLTQDPAPDPVVFNGLVCLGVFISSLLVPIFTANLGFTFAGLLGGVLFVFAALFSFVAIPRAGLATAQAVWSCSAILVSFAWGAFGPSEVAAPLGNAVLSAVAVVLLLAGALAIVNCEALAQRFLSRGPRRSLNLVQDGAPASELALVNFGRGQTPAGDEESEPSSRMSGILFAAAVGLFGGSVLVPFRFVPPELVGLRAVPSFGLGALLAGLLVTLLYAKCVRREPGLLKVRKDALGAGLVSGFLWNAGNICSIIAQNAPMNLPYGIAYPILQCSLFFGGLWGIYIFKEIRGMAVLVFWLGALVLAAGIVLLGLFGPGA